MRFCIFQSVSLPTNSAWFAITMTPSSSRYMRPNGTLNYFSVRHENMPVTVNGNTATLTGQSCVAAVVFGGVEHHWRLQQRIKRKKENGAWLMTEAVASTY